MQERNETVSFRRVYPPPLYYQAVKAMSSAIATCGSQSGGQTCLMCRSVCSYPISIRFAHHGRERVWTPPHSSPSLEENLLQHFPELPDKRSRMPRALGYFQPEGYINASPSVGTVNSMRSPISNAEGSFRQLQSPPGSVATNLRSRNRPRRPRPEACSNCQRSHKKVRNQT